MWVSGLFASFSISPFSPSVPHIEIVDGFISKEPVKVHIND